MDANDLEPITEENWPEAASALCRAAMSYETLLVKCLEQRPELIQEIITPYLEDFDTFKAVVDHWRHFLEITDH